MKGKEQIIKKLLKTQKAFHYADEELWLFLKDTYEKKIVNAVNLAILEDIWSEVSTNYPNTFALYRIHLLIKAKKKEINNIIKTDCQP